MILKWINTIAINYHRSEVRLQSRFLTLFDICGPARLDSPRMDTANILTLCCHRDRMLFQQLLVGLTTKEIAEKRGGTPTAIRIGIMRARRAIRTLVAAGRKS